MAGDAAGERREPVGKAGSPFLFLILAFLPATSLDSAQHSLSETLAARFPAIRDRLDSPVRLEPTSWRQGTRRITGLRARQPAASIGQAGEPDRVRVSLPSVATDPVVAEGEGVRVVLAPVGAKPSPAEADGPTVAFSDVYSHTDALHVVRSDWTEEYLHLRSARAPRRFEYDVVETSGATRVLLEEGQVRFLDDAGKGLVVLAPVVVDSIGRRSAMAARWSLEGSEPTRRLALTLDPGGLEYPLLVDPTWITTGSLAAARLDATGILLHNGKVLVMGNTASSELYDPATGVWTAAGAGWPGRSNGAAVMLKDGRVLACGGFFGPTFNQCRRYDPVANSWTVVANMASAREELTLSLLGDGRVLATGGASAPNAHLATAELYNPVSNTWSPTGSLSAAKGYHSAAVLRDGRVLVAGGLTLPGPVATRITEIYDPGTGLWTRVGDMVNLRHRHMMTLLPDGRVLVAGGNSENRAEVFDPGSGTWSATNPMSSQRGEASATLLPSGRVIVVGGLGASPWATTELYDYVAGTWSAGPSLTTARYRHSSTMLPDGRLLVASGFNAASLLTVQLLDNDTPSWTATSSMGIQRTEASATALKSGQVLVVGNASGVGNTAEVYDPAAGTWTPTTNNLSANRSRHSATLLVNGRVLIAGGQIATGSSELYDPPTNSWLPTGSMSGPREDHTATLLPCGEVLVAGGNSSVATAERYNPRTGRWRPTGSMNTGRYRHTATLLKDGRVLVTGGWNSGSPTATAEVYDPVSEAWTPLASPMSAGRYHHTATLLPNGKVLITGGSFASGSADLFNPATNSFAATGALVRTRDLGFTATLLPNGRVLVVGGTANPTQAEVYDPAVGQWTLVAVVPSSHQRQVAAILPDGRVLVAGGILSAAAELYDVGRGELAGWRPILSTVTDPVVTGTPLLATGVSLQGLGEGSSGLGYMHSAANYPLVQLRRLDNELVTWLPADQASGWSGTTFRTPAVSGVPAGIAIATAFTNGIPSASKGLTIECPAPTITTPPANQTVCQGGAATFTAAASGECPSYQWRRNATPLTEGAPFLGTGTPALTVSPAGLGDAGSYDVEVSLACSSTVATSASATLTVTPTVGAVDASISGPSSVCTTCVGGTASETHSGGGAVTHQWGFRTTSGGPITDIPAATLPTYALSGADFPGVGNYFLVVKVTATCGGLVVSDEVPVTVANAAGPTDEVSFFTVTTRDSQNVLEWVYPAGFGGVRIRFNTGSPCVFPNDADTSFTFLSDETGAPGGRDGVTHGGLSNGTTYCYTIFVDKGAGLWSLGRHNSGKPFSTSGPTKWAFQSGAFSTTAPTVGAAGVIATNNDNTVHAMTRGSGLGSGEWPIGWMPALLGGAVQGRSPVVPIAVGASSSVVFLGAQDGNVYTVDSAIGAAASSPWPGAAPAGGLVQAAPAGIFTAFGGVVNYLLVGTRMGTADNLFRAFNPATGAVVATFDNGGGATGIGIISSMAAVDYATSRVYFTSRARAGGSSNTLWCLQLGTAPVFTLAWARALGDIDAGPVLRGGRVYVGSAAGGGTLYSIDAATGLPGSDRSFVHGDGLIKGFVFPDRNSPTGDLYFAGNTRVWGVTEIGAVLANKFAAGLPLPGGAVPSALLFHPGSHFVYVGGSDGWLYQVDTLASPPTADYAAQLGTSPLTIGAPSLDIGNGLVHVGSEAGTFFAVQVPVASPNLCTTSCLGKPAGVACTTTAPPCTQTCNGAGACLP